MHREKIRPIHDKNNVERGRRLTEEQGNFAAKLLVIMYAVVGAVCVGIYITGIKEKVQRALIFPIPEQSISIEKVPDTTTPIIEDISGTHPAEDI